MVDTLFVELIVAEMLTTPSEGSWFRSLGRIMEKDRFLAPLGACDSGIVQEYMSSKPGSSLKHGYIFTGRVARDGLF